MSNIFKEPFIFLDHPLVNFGQERLQLLQTFLEIVSKPFRDSLGVIWITCLLGRHAVRINRGESVHDQMEWSTKEGWNEDVGGAMGLPRA